MQNIEPAHTARTVGYRYRPSIAEAFGRYSRIEREKGPDGAGSQFDSWPGGGSCWM